MGGEVRIKRIYDEADPEDGHRVLVDRLWPRGISRERAALDEWRKDLAPSPELRTWWRHDPERFAEFADRYRAELAASRAADDFRAAVRARPLTTLLFAAHDPRINHAVVLRDVLRDE